MDKRYGICHLPLIPLRASATHRAEMVSQVIFGQIYTITQTEENWLNIKLINDGYEGWIDKNQYQEMDALLAEKLSTQKIYYTANAITQAFNPAKKENIYIPFGAALHHLAHNVFNIGDDLYEIKNANVVLPEVKNFTKMVENTAQLFINAPYLWGGKTHLGIDCSGFTQQVFKLCGIQLPRDAWQQAQEGVLVDFLETVQLGDLAFFDNAEGKIIHVGMLLNKHQIIHASGKVKIDRIDNYGIFSEQLNAYSHTLRIIKRMVIS